MSEGDTFVTFYETELTLSEVKGSYPETITAELRLSMARQLERSVDLRMRYLMGEFKPPTNFPHRRRLGTYFDLGIMS